MIVPMHAFTTPDPTMEQMLLHLRQASDIARAAMEQGHHPFGALLVGPDHETVLLIQGNVDSVNHAEAVLARQAAAKFDAELAGWLTYGASPRGTIALDRCARAHAWLAGRDFVSPEDIQAVLFDVLRHRIILSFEAEAAGIDQDRVVQRILDVVAVA